MTLTEIANSTAQDEAEISLEDNQKELVKSENVSQEAKTKHNKFLKELGLPPLP